jgi:prepilin signal peptidase PulO-like enzyme (type II secretory pathway)
MITAFFVFIIGACIGSFCSALLHRTRNGGSVVTGRSQCASCKRVLGPLDLIPIVSWIVARGRCRHCHARFSWQYLALEIGFGAMFVAAYHRYCAWNDFCPTQTDFFLVGKLAIFLVFLGLIFVYDARHGEIPDSYSVVGAIFAFIANIFMAPGSWYWYLAAAAAGAGFFGIQYAASRGKWVGDGDIMMGMMMGMMLGWPGIFMGILVAYVLGLVYVSILMIIRRKRLTDTIPLGPLLAIGTAVTLLAPPSVITRFAYAFMF